jgi:hypothetical protein
MPTTPLPGMGATIRTRIASMAIAKSSASEAILEILMPGPGRNSYMVTTGPGRISTTSPSMPKSASLARSFAAVLRKTSLSKAVRSFRSQLKTSSGGRVKRVRPPTNSNCSWSLRAEGLGGAFGSTMRGVRAGTAAAASSSRAEGAVGAGGSTTMASTRRRRRPDSSLGAGTPEAKLAAQAGSVPGEAGSGARS